MDHSSIMQNNPWTLRSGRLIYDNEWITVFHENVLTPNGTEGIYGKVHFKNEAVGIVPLFDNGDTMLVGQYRYVLNRWSWEIPEGGSPRNEEPIESAKRELREETGIKAEQWEFMGSSYLSNSVSDEKAYFYIARQLTLGHPQPDITEKIELWRLPFTQALDMVRSGEIDDAMSIMALMKAQFLLSK